MFYLLDQLVGKELKSIEQDLGAGLELGGKDPVYVRYDCNLEHVIANLVDGSYFNSGQSHLWYRKNLC